MKARMFLNEDEKTNIITMINAKLNKMSVKELNKLLGTLKSQDEKKFTGRVDVVTLARSPLSTLDYFEKTPEMSAKLVNTDPNDRSKIASILTHYGLYDYKVEYKDFVINHDVYTITYKQSGRVIQFEAWLFRK